MNAGNALFRGAGGEYADGATYTVSYTVCIAVIGVGDQTPGESTITGLSVFAAGEDQLVVVGGR